MAIKKSALYSSLWKSCDELRGGMDASQYKDYVLTLLFVKYVSDKYTGKPNSLIEIPAGGGFADLVTLKGDKEIGDKINKAIGKLAEVMVAETQATYGNTFRLDIAGLPANFMPLFAEGHRAFITKDDQVVVHGGISVEELLVPFIKVRYVN